MRVLRVYVPTDRREAAVTALEEQEMTAIATPVDGRDGVLVEAPLPSNAVGPAFDALESAGVDIQEYTVVASAETAMTATSEALERRYVGAYEPLTAVELRSKARDLSRDRGSYSALMVLSAIIAAAGLLVDSPAIVVGSMVIAPIIGPALTASVGTVTGDWKMVTHSLWMQLYGLAVAVLAAAALGVLVRASGVLPPTLDLPALELFGVRLAPNALSLLVGFAAGGAAGIGLTTKGPTSIIGVMVAAALIPAAAATGIAVAWREPALALGTAALVLATLVAINLATLAVLVGLGYRDSERPSTGGSLGWSRARLVALAVAIVALTLAVGLATADQVVVDRHVAQSVEATLDEPAYDDLTAVAVRTQYGDLSPFTGPRSVTVVVSTSGGVDTGQFATDVAERITDRTGESIEVSVRSIEHDEATGGEDEVAGDGGAEVARSEVVAYPSKGSSGSYPIASTAASSTASTFSSSVTLM